MHNTTVLARLPAAALNLRTEAAHTGVSTLGKIFSTLRWPASEDNDTSARSAPTRENSAATAPTAGNSPRTSTGLPFRVTLM